MNINDNPMTTFFTTCNIYIYIYIELYNLYIDSYYTIIIITSVLCPQFSFHIFTFQKPDRWSIYSQSNQTNLFGSLKISGYNFFCL